MGSAVKPGPLFFLDSAGKMRMTYKIYYVKLA